MEEYVENTRPHLLTNQLKEEDEERFFLQANSSPINRMTQNLSKRFGFTMATSTEIRKAEAVHLPDVQRSKVTETLSHTKQTEDKCYTLVKGVEDSVEAYKILHGKEQKKTPRRKFSSKEVTLIAKYFLGDIEQGITPKLAACKGFLNAYPEIDRTPKNIQDKVHCNCICLYAFCCALGTVC